MVLCTPAFRQLVIEQGRMDKVAAGAVQVGY